MVHAPSLEGRRFRAAESIEGGEVEPETVFAFRETAGVVWAEYAGGEIVRGFLVGRRDRDHIDFRYVQLNRDGGTSCGRSIDRIHVRPDGLIELHEKWEWESRRGNGTSVLLEEAKKTG